MFEFSFSHEPKNVGIVPSKVPTRAEYLMDRHVGFQPPTRGPIFEYAMTVKGADYTSDDPRSYKSSLKVTC